MSTEILAGNILAAMGRRRVSQRMLARELGLSPTAVHMRLRGQTRISSDELVKIAALLDVEPGVLLRTAS